MTFSGWIQLAAVLAALAASLIALRIATVDRKRQLGIAQRALEHDRLALELE